MATVSTVFDLSYLDLNGFGLVMDLTGFNYSPASAPGNIGTGLFSLQLKVFDLKHDAATDFYSARGAPVARPAECVPHLLRLCPYHSGPGSVPTQSPLCCILSSLPASHLSSAALSNEPKRLKHI